MVKLGMGGIVFVCRWGLYRPSVCQLQKGVGAGAVAWVCVGLEERLVTVGVQYICG